MDCNFYDNGVDWELERSRAWARFAAGALADSTDRGPDQCIAVADLMLRAFDRRWWGSATEVKPVEHDPDAMMQ